MKKFLIILVLLLLTTQNSPAHAQADCHANTTQDLTTCVTQAQSGQIDTILIDGNIRCTSSTPCDFTIAGLTKPLTIRGTNANSGFTRDGTANKWVFRFAANPEISLLNLKFNDVNNTCNPTATSPTCIEAILLHNTKKILVDHIEMTDITYIGLNLFFWIDTAPVVTIQNSSFKNIGLHAIHSIYRHETPEGGIVKILNNNFDNIKSSAFNLNVNSSSSNPSLVSGNTIRQSHNTPMYFLCNSGDGRGPVSGCPGGQIYFYAPVGWDPQSVTQNVIVENNLITDGFTNTGISVWGIEVLRYNIKNITIRNNVLANNNTAIIIDADETPGSFLTNNIVSQSNYFYNNTKISDNYAHRYPLLESGNIALANQDEVTSTFAKIRPSPPPSPNFQITVRPGDLNGDGSVNLGDYNLLINGYGTTYSLQDYNQLVINYDK